MMDVNFKGFLLNEEKQYFGAKVGDILNSMHDLGADAENMGTRHLTKLIEGLVNQIRQILRSRWSIRQRPYLEQLQKVGVALMKAIDEKGDLAATLQAGGQAVQEIVEKLGTPINQMGSGLAEN